jgi:methylase of polypeptide subunit release factors
MRATAWPGLLDLADPNELLKSLSVGLGFGPAATAGADTRLALGVPEDLTSIQLAAGPGTTRLMLVVGRNEVPGREQVVRLAGGLSRKAPHLLWLAALVVPGRSELVLATWHAGSSPPRVAALVVDRHQVLPSDAETLTSLAASLEGSDLEIHAHWMEILGREAISRRFFLTLHGILDQLARQAAGKSPPGARREIALLFLSRLLFLAFLEARGWLDSDHRFLARAFDGCMATGGRFQRRVLEPLFFGTLNTPTLRRAPLARSLGRIPFLNGGLFSRAPVERMHRDLVMRDEDFGEAFDQLLVRYRFTPREETSTWQESAIDPEILGRAFESLMAQPERRATGAFYTPLSLVARVTDSALETILDRRGLPEGTLERVASGDTLVAPEASALRAALTGLRVLDPACGSGAFLVHLLDRLTHLRLAAGDARSPSVIRREVVTQSLFGVDVNPTAVWLCELRLWLSLVIDHPATDPSAVPPLPNLDHNIRCGDTLAGGDFSAGARASRNAHAALLRSRYARATGARKRSLSRALERLERANLVAWVDARLEQVSAQRRSLVAAARGRDLFGGRRGVLAHEREETLQLRTSARELRNRRRAVLAGGALPFVFAAQFPDAARAGGFDLVVSNPPWIRVHHIPPTLRDALRREFRVYREAAWVAGARAARAGSGFGSQVDAASLFVERSHQLLREGGVLSLLVPSKLWRSLAGGGVRRLIGERSTLAVLEDWSEAPAMFDAATYPSLVVASTTPPEVPGEPIRLAVHRGRIQVAWRSPRSELPLDKTAGAPWITLPPDARVAFDRLARHGVPLSESGLGVATLGVKCGCNEAFLVQAANHIGGIEVTDGTRAALLEPRFVRPLLRGESVRAWRADGGRECIVFPYTEDGRVLDRLPPSLRTWLLPWRARLESRTDARGKRAWWSLFRLEGSRADRPRVVWADLGRSLQAMVLDAGDRTVPLNTCYVLPARDLVDALALSALLNSPIADAWVGAIAEPARGGYRRHFAWTMARLPVPDDWARARDVLAPLGARGLRNEPPSQAELAQAVLDAFRLRQRSIAPLLEWMSG